MLGEANGAATHFFSDIRATKFESVVNILRRTTDASSNQELSAAQMTDLERNRSLMSPRRSASSVSGRLPSLVFHLLFVFFSFFVYFFLFVHLFISPSFDLFFFLS